MSPVSKATSVCVSSSIWRKCWIMFLSIESGTGVTNPFDSSVTVSGRVPSSICLAIRTSVYLVSCHSFRNATISKSGCDVAIRSLMSAIESPVKDRIAAIIDTGQEVSAYRNRKMVIADCYEGRTPPFTEPHPANVDMQKMTVCGFGAMVCYADIVQLDVECSGKPLRGVFRPATSKSTPVSPACVLESVQAAREQAVCNTHSSCKSHQR